MMKTSNTNRMLPETITVCQIALQNQFSGVGQCVQWFKPFFLVQVDSMSGVAMSALFSRLDIVLSLCIVIVASVER